MAATGGTLEAIKYGRGSLALLDQKLLPTKFEYVPIRTCEDGWDAIHSMKVRGAPAIAIAAALSLAVEAAARRGSLESAEAASAWVAARLAYLKSSRPTAVNLFEAADRLAALARTAASAAPGGQAGAQRVLEAVVGEAEAMLAADVAANKAMGAHGAAAVRAAAGAGGGRLTVLTHCNTGSLATAGYGTALGVVRALWAQAQAAHGPSAAEHFHAYCTETRPYNQGARLTAYELVHDGIPATLITDSMAAALMRTRGVGAVLVGADRVAANGDTANKIGTYGLAVAARHHGVPFFVVAPTTTLDPRLPDGSHIRIEERPADELTHVNGVRLAAPGIGVWNPAFDVTPAALVSAIVTEQGVLAAPYDVPAFLRAHGVSVTH